MSEAVHAGKVIALIEQLGLAVDVILQIDQHLFGLKTLRSLSGHIQVLVQHGYTVTAPDKSPNGNGFDPHKNGASGWTPERRQRMRELMQARMRAHWHGTKRTEANV